MSSLSDNRGAAAALAIVQAPGKAMLIGEYAVLDGAPAVVAAVGCYARATLAAESVAPASAFISAAMVQAAQALLAAELRPVAGTPVVDSAAFQRDGRKLGLGSSAAVTVAAVGVLCAAAGLRPEDPGTAALIRRAAAAAHDEAQGVRGSGADVLASALGGVRVLQDPTPRMPLELRGEVAGVLEPLEGATLTLPVEVLLVATGQAASTPHLVARYRAGVAEGRAVPARDQLSAAAHAFLAAARAGDEAALLRAVASAFQGYLALGEALGEALVTASHAALAEAARALGGAAKPSGAGGGDLAVVFLPRQASAAAAQRQRAELALRLPAECALLDLEVGARGVHALAAGARDDLDSSADEPQPRTNISTLEGL